ncbi:hypothetical protein F511_12979 [Dorcoceras hygrometricum]|uniref:WRKY19-like zinc finger domain-containing protein n=1 Tax=Dorcoceras hygrometricum TaxID=472368 RepID=A0A2Z7BH64_9LAMI|nr:hypothetical protein F511_12979 [Dorcoceras hygrometricum]
MSSPSFFKRSQRKCSTTDQSINLKYGPPGVLELGRSSSSCIRMFSEHEIEEESSIDLGLSINLKVGDNGSYSSKKASVETCNASKTRRPILDLQLTLSAGPADSDVTTESRGFFMSQIYSNSPALMSTLQLVDEGSTSSRWKTGPLIPPLQNVKIPIPFDQDHGCGKPNQTQSLVSNSYDIDNEQPLRKTRLKACTFEGCSKGARGASGRCIAHGGGRRCQRAGCQKGAEGNTVFCKAHGGGRRCQHLGCTKSAEGRTEHCIGHGGGRRCSHEGCTRAARGKSGLCIRHGGGKRCIIENCERSAEGIVGLCISHGGGRRCQYPQCSKGAQGSTMFCKAHGGGRRCTFLGCQKGAEGSTSLCKGHGGGKRCSTEGCTKSVHGGTLFCVSHGGGKRCAVPECTKSARGRTNYCVRHGGGKRCKFEGCPKSAQGSTEFCKAHGGGKRCSWGRSGSGLGSPSAIPCDKFARKKSGLCSSHGTEFQDNPPPSTSSCPLSLPILPQDGFWDLLSLPEGRVHGGSLMAMLRGDTTFGTQHNSQEGDELLEPRNPQGLPHSWV